MARITDQGMRQNPQVKDVWLVDDGARGEGRLVGRITPAGHRSFYYRYSLGKDKRVTMPLGAYRKDGDGETTFTVQQARDRVRELVTLYRTGVRDVREHLDAERADAAAAVEQARTDRVEADEARSRRLTVRGLFDQWKQNELKRAALADGSHTGRKDDGAFVEGQFTRHVFPHLGGRAVEDVTKNEWLSVVDKAKAAGKLRTAAMLLSDLRQMLSYASDREIVPVHPLATVRKARTVGKAVDRDRALSDDELIALAGALPRARLSERTIAAVWVVLATGVRIGEAMGATWADALPPSHDALAALAEETGVKFGAVDLDKVLAPTEN